MIIQELFQKCTNFDTIWENFKENFYDFEAPTEYQKAKAVFNELKEKKDVVISDNVVFAIPYFDTDVDGIEKEFYDTFFFEKERLQKEFETCRVYKSLEDFQGSNYENRAYSLIGVDRYELLGFQFAEECLNKNNFDKILAQLFWEMTWYGWDYEQSKLNFEKEVKILEESIKDIENSKTLSIEEVFKELGIVDNRTEEEKEIARRERNLKFLETVNKKNEIILEWSKNHPEYF